LVTINSEVLRLTEEEIPQRAAMKSNTTAEKPFEGIHSMARKARSVGPRRVVQCNFARYTICSSTVRLSSI
jgi:hypothetical protein